jgi:hypothetical protein
LPSPPLIETALKNLTLAALAACALLSAASLGHAAAPVAPPGKAPPSALNLPLKEITGRDGTDEVSTGQQQPLYADPNFGRVNIDWANRSVTLEIAPRTGAWCSPPPSRSANSRRANRAARPLRAGARIPKCTAANTTLRPSMSVSSGALEDPRVRTADGVQPPKPAGRRRTRLDA